MKKALVTFTMIFGATCVLIALAHIAVGPGIIPGSLPVNANMDSEDRFYATLFLGFGVAVIWASRDLSQRRGVYLYLLSIFFAGGVARLISVIAAGWPDQFFIVLMAIELILPVVCWRWLEAVR